MKRRIVISGLGVVSALGNSTSELWDSLISGISGIDTISDPQGRKLEVKLGARARYFSAAVYFSASEITQFDRHTQFAIVAAREALSDSGLTSEQLRNAAVVIGTGCGSEEAYEETYDRLFTKGKHRVHPLTVPKAMPTSAACNVSMQFGITGPVFTVTSACASGNHAIAQAALMIRSGLVDIALVGGADAPFSYGMLKSWEALRALTSDACRPFSADRSGLVMGEGAGILVLESYEHAIKRNATPYVELSGFGMSADAEDITNPSAKGAAKAIQAALIDAQLTPEQIDYVNAHGTGTIANDSTETTALHDIFGDHAKNLLVSSTKSMHGHAMGASSAIELIAATLTLRDGIAPPTINFTTPGEGCDLNYVPNKAQRIELNAAISNSFAFGGLNAVVALQKL
jgi:nodulation protein E